MLILIAFSLLISGCTISPAGIAPSTSPITSNDKVTKLGKTDGKAWGVILFGMIPLSEAWTSRAVERAKMKKNADALIDVTLDQTACLFPFATIYITEVKGEAVKIEKGAM